MSVCGTTQAAVHWALQAAALRTHCHARLKQLCLQTLENRRVGKRITLTSAAIMLLSRLLSPPQAKSTPARLLMPSK